MSDVFISYSRKDKAFVLRLHEALRSQNRETWVDWDAIEWTEDWWNAIARGIEGTNTFVFVISPDSVASSVCRDEIDHAVKHNKRLVPVVYRDVDAGLVHEALSKLNWLFFRESDPFEPMFGELVSAIDTDLEYVKAHTRLEVKAIEWDQKERNESFLLRGMDLSAAETWLLQGASKQPQPTQLQGEYISGSRSAETERQRVEARRQRAFMAGVGTFALVALGAAGFAFQQRQEAFAQRQEAQDQRQVAEGQSVIAEREKRNAQAEKQRAEEALKQAETAKKTAEQRARETRVALAATEIARRNEAQQREVAQARQQQAEAAQQAETEQRRRAEVATGVANERTVEAQKQTQIATVQTALAEKRRKNAELKAQSLTSLNLLASDLSIEAMIEGLRAGHKLKHADKDIDPDTAIQVVTALRQVVYGINERNRLEGHSNSVNSVSFSPDGKTIATGGSDKTVKLWNLEGQELRTLKGHRGSVNSVSFSPDGKTIATGSWDKIVILWNLDLDDLQQRGCQWLDDYLKHNPNGKQYQDLCQTAAPQRALNSWEQTISLFTQLFKW